MSIFRDTLPKNLRDSLEARQDAMTDRSPQNIQYLNSRNAWIRMTSAVNINGSAELAKKYVLQGGTLNSNNTLKTGIGTSNELYSTTSPGGQTHRLGIRPMPGITGIDVKSLGAYGSLREITVNFQCWDIRQLEDLEQLYMRTGYTALVEWGWAPYIGPDKKYYPTYTDFFSDELLNPKGYNKEKIFQELYNRCLKTGGNYDAMYGYIKNYQWSAREDGGYDCKTVIMSLGELVESLKINYVRGDLAKYNMYKSGSVSGDGFLNDLFTNQGAISSLKFADYYQKNTLAGVWAELSLKLTQNSGSVNLTSKGKSILENKFITPTLPGLAYYGDLNQFVQPDSKIKAYITLEAAFDIMNEYVIAKSNKDGQNAQPLVKLSTKTQTYTGESAKDLLCVAHPSQVSVDPTTCLIKSPLWYEKISPVLGEYPPSPPTPASTTTPPPPPPSGTTKAIIMGDSLTPSFQQNSQRLESTKDTREIYWKEGITLITLKQYIEKATVDSSVTHVFISIGTNDTYIEFKSTPISEFVTLLKSKFPNSKIYIIKGLYGYAGIDDGGKGYDGRKIDKILPRIDEYYRKWTNAGVTVLSNEVGRVSSHPSSKTPSVKVIGAEIDSIVGGSSGGAAGGTFVTPEVFKLNAGDAVATINILKDLQKDFFTDKSGDEELGIIGNIYVSLDFLYRQSLNAGAEASDSQEKNEINLYTYLKNIANNIQTAIGSLTNFEIHVDPVDNIARIIDVNYTVPNNPSNLFKLKLQNTNSVVRSYSLQSQIFPSQTSLIAIGAQSKGGQLGIQNNTMVDFNKNLTDRIIVDKEEAKGNSNTKNTTKEPKLAASLAGIVILFGVLAKESASQTPGVVNIDELLSKSKNALRDLIVFFQNLPGIESPGKNRNIIPTKFSFEMDGIGGIVIGSLIDMDRDMVPEGYKGGKVGSRLAQTVIRIQHSISGEDWKTRLETLNIILEDRPKGTFNKLDIKKIVTDAINAIIGQGAGNPPFPLTTIIQGFQNIIGGITGGFTGDVGYVPGSATGGTTKVINGQTRKNGEIEDLLIDLNTVRSDLYKKHNISHTRDNNRIRAQAAPLYNLIRLLEAATADGLTIKVLNAFRTYEDQVYMWKSNCSNAIGSGKCKTKPGICCPAAIPGGSNHGWGMAFDLCDNNGAGLDPKTNPTYWAWMQANQKRFGFKNCNTTNESHHYDYLGPLDIPTSFAAPIGTGGGTNPPQQPSKAVSCKSNVIISVGNPSSTEWAVVYGGTPSTKYGASYMQSAMGSYLNRKNVIYSDWENDLNCLLKEIQNKQPQGKIKSVSGFSQGGIKTYGSIPQYSFIGLIDPALPASATIASNNVSKVRMIYRTANWSKDKYQSTIDGQNALSKLLGSNAESVNVNHFAMPEYFAKKYNSLM